MPVQNVDTAQVLRDAVLVQFLPLQNLPPADLAAADQDPVSAMYFVFVSYRLSSVHFICLGPHNIAVHFSNL